MIPYREPKKIDPIVELLSRRAQAQQGGLPPANGGDPLFQPSARVPPPEPPAEVANDQNMRMPDNNLGWLSGDANVTGPSGEPLTPDSEPMPPLEPRQPKQPNPAGQIAAQTGSIWLANKGVDQVADLFTPTAAPAAAPAATPVAGAPFQTVPTGGPPAPNIVQASPVPGATGGTGGATNFATAAAAEEAGYEVIGQSADGGVIAVHPAEAGTPWFDYAGPSYAGMLAAAGSIYGGVKNWDDWGDRGQDYQNTRAEQQVGETVGNYFTGGLAGLANQGIRALAPHFMNEVDEFATKYGPMGIATRAFGSKKGKDQQARDAMRNKLQGAKITDDKDMLTLDNGRILDMGKDGSWKPYNIDFNKPSANQAVGWLQPLAFMVTGGDQKLADDLAGQLYNEIDPQGVMSPEQLRNEILHVYKKFQLKPSLMTQAFADMEKQGILTPAKRDAFLASMTSLRPGGGPQKLTPQPQQAAPIVSPPTGAPKPSVPPVRPPIRGVR